MTKRITDVREKFDSLKEMVLKEKIQSFEIIESKYKTELQEFVDSIDRVLCLV